MGLTWTCELGREFAGVFEVDGFSSEYDFLGDICRVVCDPLEALRDKDHIDLLVADTRVVIDSRDRLSNRPGFGLVDLVVSREHRPR